MREKEDLLQDNQQEELGPSEKLDLEADAPEASEMLGDIERGAAGRPSLRARLGGSVSLGQEDTSVALEPLYFRSFDKRPLLSREEEVAIAKRIDQGTRAIRIALRDAIRIGSRIRRAEPLTQILRVLAEVRGLSGLSATALDKTEANLQALIQAAKGPTKATASRAKRLSACAHRIREARVLLETAKDELVRYNLRLVVDIAKHYTGRGLGLLDLIQEGNMGLMKAAERYQYQKGFKFSTYATWWVRQAITRALADQSRTIRVPVHLTETSHRILRASRRLLQQLGREPRLEEVGRVLRVRPDKVHETMQAFQEPVSLDNPIGDSETLLGELIADRQAVPPDSHVHRIELSREMDRILGILTPREQTVIRMRFGIGQDEPCTLEQVGRSLSVTRERIRQIEAKALKKLMMPEIKRMFASIK